MQYAKSVRSGFGRETVSMAADYERMFGHLPALQLPQEYLTGLALCMIEENVELGKIGSPSNNASIPAGFTYLGQFIDHDLTFASAPAPNRLIEPARLINLRTPRFDLDSIYGGGPGISPFLYRSDGAGLVIDDSRRDPDEVDLARTANGIAILPDGRNDENTIIAQLTLAFIRYHNRVVAELKSQRASGDLFTRAATLVSWHYQWIVLHDYLPRIVGPAVVKDVLAARSYVVNTSARPITHAGEWTTPAPFTWSGDLRFLRMTGPAHIPLEFSAAIFRFGHSMVRNAYSLNEYSSDVRIPLFIDAPGDDPAIPDLRGGRRRLRKHRIEWRRFFNFSADGSDYPELQLSRAIDTLVAAGMGVLPPVVTTSAGPGPRSLPLRNLQRAQGLGLPSGQDVARAMGIPEELILGSGPGNIALHVRPPFNDPTVPDLKARGLSDKQVTDMEHELSLGTPLWYYTLKEAETIGNGQRLGPVGGRILAEVFVGLMLQDELAYLNAMPLWTPRAGQFGCDGNGQFGIRQLLAWAVEASGR